MRKLVVFNQVSLDGYFTDVAGDLSWAHKDDPEWNAFVSGNVSGGEMLLFGRVTYELMAGFWPTDFAMQSMPEVAKGMSALPKAVFSRTLDTAAWHNTTVATGDLVEHVDRMKQASGANMVILGSGSVVAQLAPAGLIDEYMIVVNPTALGAGRSLFTGIPQ